MRHYRPWMWDFFILLATLMNTKKREVQLLFCGVPLRVDGKILLA
ncbi:hypothetical protein PS051_23120 [Escherichia albertii]|nr:hypothetical protein [Escherichia albertii]MCU7296564.1 hypothetical protein [Escherichia albertii]MCZ8776723.1 hypothetical protein [Escherichia albertii]MCZ8824444.1 hypothetical protein [Escherichia albertii]MCZ8875756.1 hypothetical protein [Escherichia albertii]MCZ8924556.1 hypothetical protein [Escherichia albertii]